MRGSLFIALAALAVCRLEAQIPVADAAKEISAIRSQWIQFLHSRQLEPVVALYADDAVFLQPTGETIAGKDAIRGLFRQVMAAVTSDPTLTSMRIDSSGNLAYDSGEYRETLTNVATGAKTEAHGSYLTVLKHQPDGKWRIVEQMWSEAPESTAGRVVPPSR